MQAVYLSPKLGALALYQHDVAEEFARQCSTFFYGPGYPGFSPADTIHDVLAKAREFFGSPADWVVVGHAWLEDKDGAPAARFPRIEPAAGGVPAAVILNKEYANINHKLDYIRDAGFALGLTHHDNTELLTSRTGVPFHFWPFGVNHRIFMPSTEPKIYDVGFTGMLQNSTPGRQSDLRVQLMREMFWCVRDLPLRQRRAYQNLNVYFNALPRDAFSLRMNQVARVYSRLPNEEYAGIIRQCKSFITTRSPADLISTRYFECMASKTLVLAETNPAHRKVFPESCLLEFSSAIDFRKQLRAALEVVDRDAIVERAYEEVMAKHTWEKRIATALKIMAGSRNVGFGVREDAA